MWCDDVQIDEKKQRWLDKRAGKMTSSINFKIMQTGKKEKGEEKRKEYSQAAITELYKVKYERRTLTTRPEASHSNFDWGHFNEMYAIKWLREQCMNTILSCSEDFEDIVFVNGGLDGFGDSPDAYIYDFDNNIEGVIEVKCPVDVGKLEQNFEETEITEGHEHYWQLIGHFIGTPSAKYVLYLVYDGYTNTGKTIKILRDDHEENIYKAMAKIYKTNIIINKSIDDNVSLSSLLN